MSTHSVVIQYWNEHERGYGSRPDGYSLHLSQANREAFIKEYWDKQPKGDAPDTYSAPTGKIDIIDVSDELYELIKKSSNGIFGTDKIK